MLCACIILLTLWGWADPGGAATNDSGQPPRPKIGLVLGGGGAKGAAHIGVLKILEQLRIPVDYIAGTSMGAIVGSLYAAGMSPAEIENVLTKVDWSELFVDSPPRKEIDYRRKEEDYQILTKLELGFKDGKFLLPKGFVGAQKIDVLLETLLVNTSGITDFDKLPVPFRAVAADLESGEMVVIGSGNLAAAARASMSVPGVFPPVDLNGRYLIDGGIVRNLPVDIVKDMGADIIIAIDVGKPLPKREELGSPLAIMNQMIDIMMSQNVNKQIETLGKRDVYIRPELGDVTSADFQRGEEIARMGEKAAREHAESLGRYSVSPEEYRIFLARQQRERVSDIKVASVGVEGNSSVSRETLVSKVEIKPGDVVSMKTLSDDLGTIYGMGDFERVDFSATPSGGAYDLTVKVAEKSWGPDYVRFGLGLASNFQGVNEFDILTDYTMRWINRLGAEWKNQLQIGSTARVYSEFYQPLVYSRLFFVAPHVEWMQTNVDYFSGNERVAQYRQKIFDGGIDLGIQPWSYGEVRVGVLGGKEKGDLRIGSPQLPNFSVDQWAFVARGVVDQLDNVKFPRSGYFGNVALYSSSKALGADTSYNKLEGNLVGAYSFGKNTFLGSLRVGTNLGSGIPIYDRFRLGGFLFLSGLQPNQLIGEKIGFARIVYYRQLSKSLLGDLYFGGSVETGNAWNNGFDLGNLRLAGSVFLGYDTLIGPLYIAYGHADAGNRSVYLYLGRTF